MSNRTNEANDAGHRDWLRATADNIQDLATEIEDVRKGTVLDTTYATPDHLAELDAIMALLDDAHVRLSAVHDRFCK